MKGNEGTAADTDAQSLLSFTNWLDRRAWAEAGSSDCNSKCHNIGINSLKSWAEGSTASHWAQLVDFSKAGSAAKRPWTVIFPIGFEIAFGTL